mmetsp:Transcript_17891/g.26468  ORF Transcript_17891/g.26468 Transcript_17891/m.26468 type:complete len:239 (+) Transcript_17891:68-784(+)
MMYSFIQKSLLLFLVALSPASSFLANPTPSVRPYLSSSGPYEKSTRVIKPKPLAKVVLQQSPSSVITISIIGHILGGISGVPFVVGGIKNWYRKIQLPTWTPPDRIFSPVWTTLYACMGLSVARIINLTSVNTKPVQLWFLHYFLNISWPALFFGLQRLREGFWHQVVLTSSLAVIIAQFATIDKLAAYLLVPYFLWAVFAAALNHRIWQLNPGRYNNARFEADLAKLQKNAAVYAGV